ncbi:histidine phosphatase family protein [Bacillus sp. V3B]|uniref:histidine phosphatase family protein n=1 Tax=Bacillus sp. V3B TaxID=2804915 RepID=UPI00210D2B86|nr:histidine phosphatase family protein [Bacillus sp. V3B]MCQ6276948.1 histidine phosphatase family protein [Bacillus sp. V3B]
MVYLYIVRHGETEWNKEERIQGRLNSSLTTKGKEYAKLLSERLKDTEFDHILSSPSERTLETAQLIKGNRNIRIRTDERIMEMHMGPWQGMKKTEIKALYPYEYDHFMNKPDGYRNKGAESFVDMNKRAVDFLNEIRSRKISGNLLVVTHGLFIKSLYLLFKGIDLKEIWTEPTVEGTSLTIVKIDHDRIELILEGDMSHVKGKEVLSY